MTFFRLRWVSSHQVNPSVILYIDHFIILINPYLTGQPALLEKKYHNQAFAMALRSCICQSPYVNPPADFIE